MLFYVLIALVSSSEVEHSFEKEEEVVLWYNRGVHSSSPSESYSFYDIPLCRGKRNYKFPITLSNTISGIEPLDSGIPLYYLKDQGPSEFCSCKLSPDEFQMLTNSIELGLLAEFYIDGLPMWAQIGKIDSKIYFFSTFHLTIHYNSANIIKISVQPDDPLPLYDIDNNFQMTSEISLKFSVTWIPTEEIVNYRMNTYYQSGIFTNTVHWYSLLNTSALVFIICALILVQMYRTLSNDFKRYESAEILDMPSGWKQMRIEIWNVAEFNFLLVSFVSLGTQIDLIFISSILFSIINVHSFEYLLSLVILFSGYIGGFISTLLNQYHKGWLSRIIFSGCVVPGLILFVFSMSLASGLSISLWYFFAGLGNIILFIMSALKHKKINNAVVRITSPVLKKKKWYQEIWFLVAIGGLLPFIVIAFEFHYFLLTFVTYQFYYMYGFALISAVQMIIALGCVGIVTSYVVVNSEDHRWQWSSFLTGGSLGLYVWIYSVYFVMLRGGADGIFSFFIYATFAAVLIFLAAGSISYFTARAFLEKLYDRVKFD